MLYTKFDIFFCIMVGDVACVKQLIDQGDADVNVTGKRTSISNCT